MSRNSFGSDTNLVQSARAAVACRESMALHKEEHLIEAIKTGNITEVFKWIVAKNFDLNSTITIGSSFTTALHLAAMNVKK